MCGIAGILGGGEAAIQAMDRMVGVMHHRGPDDAGVAAVASGDVDLIFGNTRLAIIDLTHAGHMPMQDPVSGNWITYNGEIFNFRELRSQLEASGEVFRSGTDTEVILASYRRYGLKCLERFEGMFAFGLWDHFRQELVLARDRAGKKPLYYCSGRRGAFLFASEVRALLASGEVDRTLDPAGLEIYLFNGFMVSPRTLVKGVMSLLPGCWMRVSSRGRILETVRYWQIPIPSAGPGRRSTRVEETRACLEKAVTKRLVSDVPLGAFLSGGLDSSATVALMARSGGDVRTFSIAFEETRFDESPYSRWVAERFGTSHREINLGRAQFLNWLDGALAAMDQPTYDGVNSYCVSRAARENGLTVALSGAGGDEVFGGYPFFKTVPWLASIASGRAHFPISLRRPLESLWGKRPRGVAGPGKVLELGHASAKRIASGKPALVAYQVSQMLLPAWVRNRLHPAGPSTDGDVLFGLPIEFVRFLEEELAEAELMDQVSVAAWRLFLGERCLRDIDSMSMAVSLEVRAPFVDHLFIESVFAIQPARRCRGVPDKPFEMDLIRPYVGEDYPYRRKQGFLLPLEVWMQEEAYRERVLQTLGDASLVRGVGLVPDVVKDVGLALTQRGWRMPWSRVWSLFVLLKWCERHQVVAA